MASRVRGAKNTSLPPEFRLEFAHDPSLDQKASPSPTYSALLLTTPPLSSSSSSTHPGVKFCRRNGTVHGPFSATVFVSRTSATAVARIMTAQRIHQRRPRWAVRARVVSPTVNRVKKIYDFGKGKDKLFRVIKYGGCEHREAGRPDAANL